MVIKITVNPNSPPPRFYANRLTALPPVPAMNKSAKPVKPAEVTTRTVEIWNFDGQLIGYKTLVGDKIYDRSFGDQKASMYIPLSRWVAITD